MLHKIKLFVSGKNQKQDRFIAITFLAGLIIVGLIGCGSSTPSDDFINSPLRVIQNNSEQGVSEKSNEDVTVGDLLTYVFTNPNTEQTWKQNSNESWSIVLNDKVAKNEMIIVINKKKSPDRAIFDRILVNGEDMPVMMKINTFYKFATAAYAAKYNK